MSLSPAFLLVSRTAALAAEEDRIKAARAEVLRLEALLAEAKQEERNTSGYMMHGRRAEQKRGLAAVAAALEGGARGIIVHQTGYQMEDLPGAVLKVTAARATVLTERGEFEFDLKGNSSWTKPGDGRGDAKAYRIDVADLSS